MTEFPNKLVDSFAQTLRYDDLDMHFVLYADRKLFQFDPVNFKIKAINSILWEDLDKNSLYTFYVYMLYKYMTFVSDSEDSPQGLGYRSGSIVYINLTNMAQSISNESNDVFRITVTNKSGVLEEFFKFYEILESIYKKNESIINFVIENL